MAPFMAYRGKKKFQDKKKVKENQNRRIEVSLSLPRWHSPPSGDEKDISSPYVVNDNPGRGQARGKLLSGSLSHPDPCRDTKVHLEAHNPDRHNLHVPDHSKERESDFVNVVAMPNHHGCPVSGLQNGLLVRGLVMVHQLVHNDDVVAVSVQIVLPCHDCGSWAVSSEYATVHCCGPSWVRNGAMG